ncbi:hypothetical protein AB1Y20_012599 [Prymnesium parvum]|uniref:Galactosyl transferase GMA12/MNN10 family protein n=1 Tax=Prymnesium parvum TaxID=97485 RepID=A0AB34IL01_PRYPA
MSAKVSVAARGELRGGLLATPLELPYRRAPSVSLIQFSDRAGYEKLMQRNERWARMRGYSYTVRTARVLQRTHAVYFEKVRMALDAFDEGAEWVLWVDDDATINRADLSAASFIDLFPQADLIIAREALAWVHGVTATHYHNWGVWLARNSAWMRNMLHAMLHDPRCSDLTTTEVKGNPEQDCFTRFVHVAPAGVRLVYMFEELQRSLNSLPLNKTTMAHVGEAAHVKFSCIADILEECHPWFLHFQGSHKYDDLPLLERRFERQKDEGAAFSHSWQSKVVGSDRRIHYRQLPIPCFVTPLSPSNTTAYRFVGSISACEGNDLPRWN